MPTLSHRSSASLPEPPTPLSYPKGNARASDVLTGGPLDTAPPGVIEDKPILQILKQPGRTDIFLTQTNWLLLSFSGICHKANTQKQEN